MAEHAKFAPSGAHRWIACPGSIRLGENIESYTSEYAMEGTALHGVTEKCLREKLPAVDFVGMTLDSVKDDPMWSMEMDDDHAEAVQYCVDEVKRIMDEYKIKGGKLEIRVVLNEQCWGTVDVLLWNDEWVIVIDFKFGRGKSVEATGNPQLMIYYLGALKYLNDEGITIPPKALLIIIQPRIPNPTRMWETTMEEVKTWYVKSVKPAFDAAEQDDAVCNPGEDQCQFCPANGVCTARANHLLGVVEDEFGMYADPRTDSDLPMVPEVKSLAADIRGNMETALDLMSPEIAGKIMAYRVDFDNFFKSVGEYATNTAKAGTEIPGFKLVYGRSNRKWGQPDAQTEKLLKEQHSMADPFAKRKLLSPAQAEKKAGKGVLDELIIKPTGKLSLVPNTDSREAADISGETDMSEFVKEGKLPDIIERGEDRTATDSNPEPPPIFEDTESIDDIMSQFGEDEPGHEPPLLPQAVPDETLKGDNPSPPSNRTKKYKLMEMGLKGKYPQQQAADTLFKGEVGQVIKGLRNLNERDGYEITIFADGTFTVKG